MVRFLIFLDDNDEIRPDKRLNLLGHKRGTYCWKVPAVCSLLLTMPNTFAVLAMTCDESELWVK